MLIPKTVKQIFENYPPRASKAIKRIRALIYNVAKKDPKIGLVSETVRWNQLSYLTEETKSGSLVRLDLFNSNPDQVAIFFHCQTTLVSDFKKAYPKVFKYHKNRAIVFDLDEEINESILSECLHKAMTYHLK